MNKRKAKISLKFIEQDEETLIGTGKIKGDTSVASAGMLVTAIGDYIEHGIDLKTMVDMVKHNYKLLMEIREQQCGKDCKCNKEKESK